MKVKVLTQEGKETGREIELADSIFGIEPNDHAVWLSVRQHQAALHQGTHKSKQRNEIAGSTRKLYKQKGTGGARKGNIRNPLYKGGGTIFGPKPHAYDFKLNRKVKDLAKISALSYKAKDNAVFVLEDINLETPKTKAVVDIMNSLSLSDKKTLIVLPEYNDNLYLSTRNIPNITSTLLADINTYEIMNADVLVITENTAKIFVDEETGVVA